MSDRIEQRVIAAKRAAESKRRERADTLVRPYVSQSEVALDESCPWCNDPNTIWLHSHGKEN